MIGSYFSYEGKVTVSLKRSGHPERRYHLSNNGTPYFFQQLCLALTGLTYQTPSFLDAGTKSGDGLTSSLHYRSPVVRKTVELDGTVYLARFVATIASNQYTGTPITRLALYGDAQGEQSQMATIELDSSLSLEAGELLTVTWEMAFYNNSSSENT